MGLLEKLLVGQGSGTVLLLCNEEELRELQLDYQDTTLSMLHLHLGGLWEKQDDTVDHRSTVLALTPQTKAVTLAERALIYAMLIRCRKVISCRDKLEDMLKYDDWEGWPQAKAAYETKVLDLYKATWRSKAIYPYNIVDNIKEYNKEESYILKQLYTHLSGRTPGQINPGDEHMLQELRRMFADISISMLQPDFVVVGTLHGAPELQQLAEYYGRLSRVKVLDLELLR